MTAFEILMVLYIPTGTLMLNKWRATLSRTKPAARVAYIFVSIALATAPFIYVRSIADDRPAFAVVLVGIAFFCFVIVAGRDANT